jgi:hypothetical protein
MSPLMSLDRLTIEAVMIICAAGAGDDVMIVLNRQTLTSG